MRDAAMITKKNWSLYETTRFTARFLLKRSQKLTLILSLKYHIKDNSKLESNKVSQHNVKDWLFPKECMAVNWDLVITLLLV